ncbi:coatomer epsilon subunit-domain-containing protein [Cokeromyces recurvatus]|uniref:coatomer epsilon subunit-domain-containing protein n=1 Tax=Cokeromyces recurvatus TaxID=90255 RepID=UPI00221F8553|nr:coatomer epsilon subunit-domain-containing protein [Cokeromyces recurvatus]KAI7902054.1 coatomer epsilon subunit-domain-containing protein [Cokeromyces recurvatus]
MDEESILFGIRNLFAVGNYQAVINEVSTTNGLFSTEAKQEAKIFLYRSYVAQGKFNLVINDVDDSQDASLKAIKLLAEFLSDKQKNDFNNVEEFVTRANALFEEGANRINSIVQVTIATLFVQADRLEDALRVIHSREKKLECSALAVQIYLQLNRLDLARDEIKHVKTWAEDALLLQLMEAWIDLRVGGEKYQEAFYIYEECAQSNTSQTVKILNGQAAANLALGRYPEAESLLLEAQNKDSNDPDTLINLITCATLTAKSQEVVNRYISQLREVAPNHPYLKDLDLKSSLFDRNASRFALVNTA